MRARRGERGAGKLLGVQAVGRALRRITADRQRAGQRLGREVVGEAGLIVLADVRVRLERGHDRNPRQWKAGERRFGTLFTYWKKRITFSEIARIPLIDGVGRAYQYVDLVDGRGHVLLLPVRID